MKRTKLTRSILLVVLVVTLLGAGFAYKEYNRKRPSAADAAVDYSENINSLSAAFVSNEKAANVKYLNKVIELKAIVHKLEKDERGLVTIVFHDSVSNTSIRCLMDSASNHQAESLQLNNLIQVKGTCTGYNPDEMGLGADIILQRTVIHKP